MRNLCCKCPHYYSEHSYDGEYDWGCRVFGSECHSCPSFWDDEGEADETEMGCNEHPKRLDFFRMRRNKRYEAWYRSSRNKKFLLHHHSGDKEKYGYKALDKNGKFMGFWTNDCRPNCKGGHHHRRNYCICHVCGNWFRRNKGFHDECSDGPLHFCSGGCASQAEYEASLEADVGGGFVSHYWDDDEDAEWKRRRVK